MLKPYYLLLFVLAIGATSTLSAQITLTAENYGVQDSVVLLDTLYQVSNFVPDIPQGGENQVWDYSNLTSDSIDIFTSLEVPEEDTCFAGAQAFFPVTFAFQAFRYAGFTYTTYTADGRFDVGIKTDGAKFPLTAVTGNPLDTLAILPRSGGFRETIIPFPATFGTISRDTFDQTANLELSVGAFGLNQTPAASAQSTTRTTEVIGYGDLILPGLADVPSAPLEALLIQQTTVEVTTYTLAGGPAPAALLQAFGAVQNDTFTRVNYFFHVKGLGRSAANLQLIPGTSTYFFQFRRVPPGTTTSLSSVRSPEPLRFSPNPVRPGEVLGLTLPAEVTGGALRLLDLQGRIVTENTFNAAPGGNVEVRVPATVKAGLYVQQVVDRQGRLVAVGKVLVQ